jgi:hypothetical protein
MPLHHFFSVRGTKHQPFHSNLCEYPLRDAGGDKKFGSVADIDVSGCKLL